MSYDIFYRDGTNAMIWGSHLEPRGSGLYSTHFPEKELRCPCCRRNNTTAELLRLLEGIREAVGRPLYLNSCCRCTDHNINADGWYKSPHLHGVAADISMQTVTERSELHAAASTLGCTRFGMGQTFLHVDVADLAALAKAQDREPLTPKAIWLYP